MFQLTVLYPYWWLEHFGGIQLVISILMISNWLTWLVVWNMNFMTFHILGTIIPIDFHIFSEGLISTYYFGIAGETSTDAWRWKILRVGAGKMWPCLMPNPWPLCQTVRMFRCQRRSSIRQWLNLQVQCLGWRMMENSVGLPAYFVVFELRIPYLRSKTHCLLLIASNGTLLSYQFYHVSLNPHIALVSPPCLVSRVLHVCCEPMFFFQDANPFQGWAGWRIITSLWLLGPSPGSKLIKQVT